MKKFKYTVDVKKLKMDEVTAKAFDEAQQKGVFENMLNMGIQSLEPGGIGGAKQRSMNRLLMALDAADGDFMNVEDSDFELLEEIFTSERTKFPAQNTRLIVQYYDAVQVAKKQTAPQAAAEAVN